LVQISVWHGKSYHGKSYSDGGLPCLILNL
jgi:hypothetical protein